MNYKKIREQLKKLIQSYKSICDCDDVNFKLEEPATESEIKQIEEQIGMPLPKDLREFFLHFSKECELSVFLPEDFKLPAELRNIFSACFIISLDEVTVAEASRKGWIENCFPDENDEYDRIWHNKLGIMTVGNGDVIALDIGENPENPSVIYLSHDDGEGHGYILGETFSKYFESLLFVGACGNEDWQMLPFCDDKKSGINPDCKNAETYRKLIRLI